MDLRSRVLRVSTAAGNPAGLLAVPVLPGTLMSASVAAAVAAEWAVVGADAVPGGSLAARALADVAAARTLADVAAARPLADVAAARPLADVAAARALADM